MTVLDLCSNENAVVFPVFEVSGVWLEKFNKLCLIQRKVVLERFRPSYELCYENVR